MGLFNSKSNDVTASERVRNPDAWETPEPMTVEERAEVLRENAIQYIIELDDKDLETFIESVRLIRNGRLMLGKVKTVEEKQAEREARKAEQQDEQAINSPIGDDDDKDLDDLLDDDDLASAFLSDDEPAKKSGYVDGITKNSKKGNRR